MDEPGSGWASLAPVAGARGHEVTTIGRSHHGNASYSPCCAVVYPVTDVYVARSQVPAPNSVLALRTMSTTMTDQKRLHLAIDQHNDRLRADLPTDRTAALLALLRVQDRLPHLPSRDPATDLISGHRLVNPGGGKALQLCLEADTDHPLPAAPSDDLDAWARGFLRECGAAAEAEQVLLLLETGSMRITADASGTFHAWLATKRTPASWRPRFDIDWWATSLAQPHRAELEELQTEGPEPGLEQEPPRGVADQEPPDRRLADLHLQRMTYQLGYPPETVIGGCTIQTYRDVLAHLIARALQLQAGDRGEAMVPQFERALVAEIATALGVEPVVIGRAVATFTLDRENAAYHAAVPGIAAAPLVRIAPDHIVLSRFGLTTEPLFFLARELKRRHSEDYHNAAHVRESVFRQDLYALFQDKRFITSAGRVKLRREYGDLRTDIDALVFDRKTGTLGLFELKSQDPFARSVAEMARQRDNVLYANRQISGVLAWLKRYGPDALLGRVDTRAAKTFRAHKVYPFVLGRYLAHFNDGAEPDRRAAWGTWPQLLRLVEDQPLRTTDANPIASLFNRLTNDDLLRPPADYPRWELIIGGAHLTVHPSYAAFRASMGNTRDAH